MKTIPQKVAVVAGGAGFLGSHLCEYLLKRNFKVICVDSLITGSKENLKSCLANPNFIFVQLDISSPRFLSRTSDWRPDYIFNLASPASPKDYLTFPLETMRVGAEGTRNLLELALRNNAVFIQASTSEVYGDPMISPQKENYWGNVNPIGPRSVYDESKRYAEALTMAYHRKYQLPVKIARIFNTYGPRMKFDDGRVVPTLIYQALTNQPMTIYGTGKQTRSFCYVSDMIRGLFKTINYPDPNPINLGNPQELTIIELARIIKNLTGSSSVFKFYPFPTDDPKQRRPDISRAKKLLNWEPRVDIERGLRLTISWFQNRIYESHL